MSEGHRSKKNRPGGYPSDILDLQQMNRIMRHRLRNLCAGVKMTVDRIADVTASTHPNLGGKCDIIKAELNNLQEFTERLDLLFDKLQAGEALDLFTILTGLRDFFASKFPFCSIELNGPEAEIVISRASLLVKALQELLLNAGEASGESKTVHLDWEFAEDKSVLIFRITNHPEKGIPDEIPFNPPEPFNTLRSRHDGIGMAIAYRICKEINTELIIRSEPESGVIAELKIPAGEFK